MHKFGIIALASAWLVGSQETDTDAYHPHASFSFIRTGERTPTIEYNIPVLTALGAQQMFQLGQAYRTRYITGNANIGLGVQHIAGMSQNLVNNDQILVQTLNQPHLVSTAQAFMQGLYPPRNTINSLGSSNGTGASTGGLLANGTAIDFPLGGYQYANIRSSGPLDAESIYISGMRNCPIGQRDAGLYFRTDQYRQTRQANAELYQRLDPGWFGGNLMRGQL